MVGGSGGVIYKLTFHLNSSSKPPLKCMQSLKLFNRYLMLPLKIQKKSVPNLKLIILICPYGIHQGIWVLYLVIKPTYKIQNLTIKLSRHLPLRLYKMQSHVEIAFLSINLQLTYPTCYLEPLLVSTYIIILNYPPTQLILTKQQNKSQTLISRSLRRAQSSSVVVRQVCYDIFPQWGKRGRNPQAGSSNVRRGRLSGGGGADFTRRGLSRRSAPAQLLTCL